MPGMQPDTGARQLALIGSYYAELSDLPVRPGHAGQNNEVAILDDRLVFRFPRNQAALRHLAVEHDILTQLAGRLSLPIPEPRYANLDAPIGEAFMGYPMVPGEPLWPATPLSAADWGRAAASIGRFLRELHGVPLALFEGIVLPDAAGPDHWEDLRQRIEAKLFPYMREEARRKVSEAFRLFEDSAAAGRAVSRVALVHGDFGPSNILYDAATRSVSGVIDFGSAGTGDPAVDLAALIGPFGFGERFLQMLAAQYPGLEALLPRARFYAGTFALQEALFGIEHGDEDAFRQGIADYV